MPEFLVPRASLKTFCVNAAEMLKSVVVAVEYFAVAVGGRVLALCVVVDVVAVTTALARSLAPTHDIVVHIINVIAVTGPAPFLPRSSSSSGGGASSLLIIVITVVAARRLTIILIVVVVVSLRRSLTPRIYIHTHTHIHTHTQRLTVDYSVLLGVNNCTQSTSIHCAVLLLVYCNNNKNNNKQICIVP